MDDAKDNGISPNPENVQPTGQPQVSNFFARRTPGDILKGKMITPEELTLATLDILKKNDDQNKLVTNEPKKIEQLEDETEKLLLELLAKIKGTFEDFQNRATNIYIYLNDEEQKSILTLISEIEALLKESESTPTFELAQKLELKIEDLDSIILHYEEQYAAPPVPPKPIDTTGGPGDPDPAKDMPHPESFTAGQIYVARAGNIGRNKEGMLTMTHKDGTPIKRNVLRESDTRALRMSNALLDDYLTFIQSIDESKLQDFEELIQKKMDLINAIESGNWKNVRLCRESLAQTLKRFQQMKDNPTGVPTPDTPSQRQPLAIETNNIWFDRGDWKIQHKDDGVVVLTDDNGLDQWMTSHELLKEYRSFLSSIPSSKYGDYQQLITLKDELMDAIEDENWDAEAKKHLELEQALREITKDIPVTQPPKIVDPFDADPSIKRNSGNYINIKNIKYVKATNKWMIGNRPMYENEYQIWMLIRPILEDCRRSYVANWNALAPNKTNLNELLLIKDKILNALEKGDFENALDLREEYIKEYNSLKDIHEETRQYNLEQLKKGYTLEYDTTNFAYIKNPHGEGLVIDRNTGNWIRLEDKDSEIVANAARAINTFTFRKSTPKGIVEKKNEILRLINDYQFAEAAKATDEYIQEFLKLSTLSEDKLPLKYRPDHSSSSGISPNSTVGQPPSIVGAQPVGPSIPQAPTVSPSTPEPYQPRLIIRMGWPSDIQFFSSKERNGWHEIDERGQWKRITSKISLWDAVSDTFNGSPTSRQIAEPLYNKYLRFFESGSYADKNKKRELYGKAIETENKIIQSLRERRPEEALSYCDMLEEELSEYIDNWNTLKPKVEEEAKNAIRMEKERESLQKDFGEKKKDLVKVLSRAEQINKEITSTLEQKHIEREVREATTRFANADTTLASVSFDPKLLSFAIEGLTQLTATLDTYENKLEAITPKKTNEKTGIVTILRPTVLNEANRNNVVRRIGKPDTTVEAWTREQERLQEDKKTDEEMVKLERIIDTLWKKHTQEFSDNPRDYYLHYILENKRGVLEPHEKRVVDDTIKRGLDAGEITQTDMNTLKKAFDLREARKSATTSVGMSKEIYSPSKEAGQIDVQKDFNAEQRIMSNLSDADVTTRRAERHIIKDALYSGGMVTGATAPHEPQAILNNPAPTPAGAPILRTQQEEMARRITAVNTLQNSLVSSRGKSWKRYAIAAGATGVGIAIGAAIHALDQPDQQESIAASTATLPPRSWRYYIQTPEKKTLLRDIESLSREQFVTKYIPGIATPSNPASIDKLLKTDAYEVLNSTEDIPGYKAEDRIKIYETLRSLEDLYAATNAPEGAQAVAKNMSYTPQEYGFITPKMTVEDFLAKVKVVVHQADEKYRLSTLTKKV